MTTGIPAASLPGIGSVPPLIGAQQPPGLRHCSQTTLWWSFIADSSASKSLLLSSLFWFMYSLIYLCMWTRGGEKRRGKEGGLSGGKKKTATATMLGTIPGGMPAVHLPFKVFSNRHTQLSRILQSLVYGSQAPPPNPSSPPESIGTVCMFCMLRQKRHSFNCAVTLWRGLNGAAHCCGNYKNQSRGKRRTGHYCSFRIPYKQKRSDQSKDFTHNVLLFHLPLPVSVTGWGKPLEGSGSTGTEEQTNLLRKEDRLQRLHSHKEWISWCRPRGIPPLYNSYQTDQWRSEFGSTSDFWSCSGI